MSDMLNDHPEVSCPRTLGAHVWVDGRCSHCGLPYPAGLKFWADKYAERVDSGIARMNAEHPPRKFKGER